MTLAVKVFIPISSHVRKLKMTDSAENADPKSKKPFPDSLTVYQQKFHNGTPQRL